MSALTALLVVVSAAVAACVAVLGVRRSRRVTGITPPPVVPTTLIAAVLGGASAAVLGPRWILAAVVVFAGGGAVLSVIDVQYARLPHAVMGPLYVAVTPLVALAAVAGGEVGRLVQAVVGALVFGVFHVVFKIVRASGIGAGDVKLSPLLGLLLGWWGFQPLCFGLILAYSLFVLVAAIGVMRNRLALTSQIPAGPYLVAGTLTGVLLGSSPLLDALLDGLWRWLTGG